MATTGFYHPLRYNTKSLEHLGAALERNRRELESFLNSDVVRLETDGTVDLPASSTVAGVAISVSGHTHTHAATTGQTANDHHNQVHTLVSADHSASGLTAGHVLRASGATTFAFAQLPHSNLGSVTANQHHNEDHAARHASGAADPLDHGTLAGLSDDDHTIYLLADGTRDVGGTLKSDTDITDELGSEYKMWKKLWVKDIVIFGGGATSPDPQGSSALAAPLPDGTTLSDDTPSATSTWEQWGTETAAASVTGTYTIIAHLIGACYDASSTNNIVSCRIAHNSAGAGTWTVIGQAGRSHTASDSRRRSIGTYAYASAVGFNTSSGTNLVRAELWSPSTTTNFEKGILVVHFYRTA